MPAARTLESSITPQELLLQIEANRAPAILDVRSRREFVRGHVPGALHIPFWAVAARVSTISVPRENAVVVYCEHGPRAWLAGAAMRRRGFQQVMYLEGHMAKWRRARLREEVG